MCTMRRSRDDIGFESKRLLRSLHTFRRDPRRHPQLFKSQRTISAAVEVNFFVKRRFEP